MSSAYQYWRVGWFIKSGRVSGVGSIPIRTHLIGLSPSGKALDFDSSISLVRIQPAQPIVAGNDRLNQIPAFLIDSLLVLSLVLRSL